MRARVITLLFSAGLAVAIGSVALRGAQQGSAAPLSVAIDADDIGGTVRGPNGPEAGVWVIAETADFPTKFRKIVVTDDRGRYLIPDLPRANYSVWVRGYGLVDSRRVQSVPGRELPLTAVPAPSARAAAQYYPANYWYSLLRVPEPGAFPLTVTVPAAGRGTTQTTRVIESQDAWMNQLKGCVVCHQMGDKATREIPASLGELESTFAGWERRLRIGGNFGGMNGVDQMGHDHMIGLYAAWTDRIRAGEVPDAPPRPQGLERNVVLTIWDAGTQTSFMHDVISTDKRNPRLNANGLVYGIDYHNGLLVIVDPVKSTNQVIPLPTRDDRQAIRRPPAPARFEEVQSPYWSRAEFEPADDVTNPNNLTMDERGRVWIAQGVRVSETPDICRAGSTNKYAMQFPIDSSDRHLSYYDPKTRAFTVISTCFRTHHINFAYDADRTIYSDGGGVIGWVNTRMLEQTGDEIASQGWCAPFLDTNSDGRIDPRTDQRITGGPYSVQPSPKDDSVWAAFPGFPGKIVRMTRGPNPPQTCIFEAYNVPYNNPAAPGVKGYLPRGIDVDKNGLVWTALAGSGHFGSFDRSKCKVLSGPTATGDHCAEGWTLYPLPGPGFKGVPGSSAEWAYYNWVDKHDTFGMGEDIPVANGTNSDSLMVLNPTTKSWTMLRVPYPIGFYQRGLDGRIDEPTTGWKGRGLWAGNGTRTPWHMETGKGQLTTLTRFQIRPDPLSK